MRDLVAVDWLNENLGNPKVVVLDASLGKPICGDANEKRLIPDSVFFDLDTTFSDTDSDLPHTMVSDEVFTREAKRLGIDNGQTIVVYDNKGIYSSPRVWYMFKSMGYHDVHVLDGGLPEWVAAGFETVQDHKIPSGPGTFEGKFNSNLFVSKCEVGKMVKEKSAKIIDARHPNRFNGLEDEPRKGLGRGHIPNSSNIFFGEVLDGYRMKSPQELKSVFKGFDRDDKLVFSCGSGVTACIDALAATLVGFGNVAVYDGSWSEWGRVCSSSGSCGKQ